ncbi:23156_t:CDS:2 [Cetraspora pellucida]|uniref:23156_t:CDS:1 n=1 Tax=Cetraspora pellucida TaxID=1433469 RepID=A0A9N8ZC18_9GLOM|nr:23156_t:CDS:2 [Cetraspora pellucida]
MWSFSGFIVLSNHDAPIHVEQEDGRIKYHTWCEANDEKLFSNNNFGKKILQVNIERKYASSRKREWQ